MTEPKSVEKGDQVEVHYSLKLEDGTVVNASPESDPLSFSAGGTEVLAPVSEGVIGMAPGEKKTLTVPPESAFGMADDELKTEVPRSKIPRGAKEGDRLTDSVSQKSWTVRELKHDVAVLDGNHPLAGQTVIVELELAAVK